MQTFGAYTGLQAGEEPEARSRDPDHDPKAGGYVCVAMSDKPLRLTAEQARYLAEKLTDAASRIETNSNT